MKVARGRELTCGRPRIRLRVIQLGTGKNVAAVVAPTTSTLPEGSSVAVW
ncbi:hypothetical protein [Pseudolysobacter antarcticus]|nr:hypothetical protein [Pseudolysobacter antarcticus]